MSQSKINSFKEAVVNTAIGFGLSFILQVYVAWAYGTSLTLWQNVQITVWFTILSLVRSYVIRRWFNKKDTEEAVQKSIQSKLVTRPTKYRNPQFGDPDYIASIDG